MEKGIIWLEEARKKIKIQDGRDGKVHRGRCILQIYGNYLFLAKALDESTTVGVQ